VTLANDDGDSDSGTTTLTVANDMTDDYYFKVRAM
jgi:hypothetical protein